MKFQYLPCLKGDSMWNVQENHDQFFFTWKVKNPKENWSWFSWTFHMESPTKDNSYKCALCGEGFISRNHLKRRMKGHAMDNPYPCALCVEKFISINHQNRCHISHTGKLHITVLFNIQEDGWIIFLVELLAKIFSFANVISRQKTSWEYPATQSLQHTSESVCENW